MSREWRMRKEKDGENAKSLDSATVQAFQVEAKKREKQLFPSSEEN